MPGVPQLHQPGWQLQPGCPHPQAAGPCLGPAPCSPCRRRAAADPRCRQDSPAIAIEPVRGTPTPPNTRAPGLGAAGEEVTGIADAGHGTCGPGAANTRAGREKHRQFMQSDQPQPRRSFRLCISCPRMWKPHNIFLVLGVSPKGQGRWAKYILTNSGRSGRSGFRGQENELCCECGESCGSSLRIRAHHTQRGEDCGPGSTIDSIAFSRVDTA